jgi:N-acyl-D-amino-acid deacylase
MPRPTRRDLLAAVAVAPFVRPVFAQSKDALPVTGDADDRLKPLDDLFTGYMTEHKLPGAAVALTRHGKLMYARGFGHADAAKKVPVQPNALFRLASVSKPITAVAVLQLVEKKKLKLDAPILEYVTLKPVLAPKEKADPRWEKVTVRHCLQHTGGWDRDKSLDPCTATWDVAKALGVNPPLTPEQVTRYALGQPIEYVPGDRYCYSNLGYLLLGRAIEAVTKAKYEEVVRKAVFAPLKMTTPSLARAVPANRPKAEVSYFDAAGKTGTGMYPPVYGKTVPAPDGAGNIEAFEAHGGWVMSAIDLVRFAAAFDDPAKCPLLSEDSIREMWERPAGAAGEENGKPKKVYYGCGWSVRQIGNEGKVNAWHLGRWSGVSTLVVRRHDGFAWAVLFNTEFLPGGKKETAGEVAEAIHPAVDAVTEWPTTDGFAKWVK